MREKNFEELYEQYLERYDIQFEQEFYVKELIKLKEQYKNTPEEHIKTKEDLMRLILRLESTLGLNKKHVIHKVFDDIDLVIVGDSRSKIETFIEGIFPSDSNVVKFKQKGKDSTYISLYTGLNIRLILFEGKPDFNRYRGIRCNKYWNLTNNEEIEEWLKASLTI